VVGHGGRRGRFRAAAGRRRSPGAPRSWPVPSS
jgi:hypothetical protein